MALGARTEDLDRPEPTIAQEQVAQEQVFGKRVPLSVSSVPLRNSAKHVSAAAVSPQRRVRCLTKKNVVMVFFDTLEERSTNNSHQCDLTVPATDTNSQNINASDTTWFACVTFPRILRLAVFTKYSSVVLCQNALLMRHMSHHNCYVCAQNRHTTCNGRNKQWQLKPLTNSSTRLRHGAQNKLNLTRYDALFLLFQCDVWTTC